MSKLSQWWRWRHVPKRMRKVFDYAIAESYPNLGLTVYKKKQQLVSGFFIGYTPNHVILQTPSGLKYVPFTKFSMPRLDAQALIEDIATWADSPDQQRYFTTQSLVEKAIHHPHYQVFGKGMNPETDLRKPVLSHEEGTWYSPAQLPPDSRFYTRPIHRRSVWHLVHMPQGGDGRLYAFFADEVVVQPRTLP